MESLLRYGVAGINSDQERAPSETATDGDEFLRFSQQAAFWDAMGFYTEVVDVVVAWLYRAIADLQSRLRAQNAGYHLSAAFTPPILSHLLSKARIPLVTARRLRSFTWHFYHTNWWGISPTALLLALPALW